MFSQLNVRVPIELIQQIRELAESRERRLSQEVRLALRKHLLQERSEDEKEIQSKTMTPSS
ncbi:hypothetical protein HYR54_10875 [Candidatus Acetothermia bacterium]|nr:hypothetical protein [Candidatus Acetothermia bacterium]